MRSINYEDIPLCMIFLKDDIIIDINKMFESEMKNIKLNKEKIIGENACKIIYNFTNDMDRHHAYINFDCKIIYGIISCKNDIIYIESVKYDISFIEYTNHEIMTPLTNFIQVINLIEDTKQTDKQKKYIGLLKESYLYLTKIINNITDYMLFSNGAVKMSHSVFLLSKSVDEVKKMTSVRKISIDFDVVNDVKIYTDYNRFNELLLHIINHCVKYTSKGFINIKFIASDKLNIYVTDTGDKLTKIEKKLLKGFINIKDMINNKHFSLDTIVMKCLISSMGGKIIIEKTSHSGTIYNYCLDIVQL
jgi:K+-sensing histidine kinase KdpD